MAHCREVYEALSCLCRVLTPAALFRHVGAARAVGGMEAGGNDTNVSCK